MAKLKNGVRKKKRLSEGDEIHIPCYLFTKIKMKNNQHIELHTLDFGIQFWSR